MVLFHLLSRKLREQLKSFLQEFPEEKLEEIRIRVGQPVILKTAAGERVCDVIAEQRDIRETLELAADHSMYAFEEDMKNGFLTVEGGHRIGVCGKIVVEGQKILAIKWISAINIRIAHEITGCADPVFAAVCDREQVRNTLIISPPECGKTTLLRDLIRQISNLGHTVSLVDERSEIASCYQGVPQNDVGMRTDVLDACPKAKGMLRMIRSMSPDVLAVDEIGGKEDMEALSYVLRCGCAVLASIHGDSLSGMKDRDYMKTCISEGWFLRYIFIEKDREGKRNYLVYDRKFSRLGSGLA